MNVPHQVMLSIVSHPISQDEILHPTTDIDWVDLDKPQMFKRCRDITKACIESCGPAHEGSDRSLSESA